MYTLVVELSAGPEPTAWLRVFNARLSQRSETLELHEVDGGWRGSLKVGSDADIDHAVALVEAFREAHPQRSMDLVDLMDTALLPRQLPVPPPAPTRAPLPRRRKPRPGFQRDDGAPGPADSWVGGAMITGNLDWLRRSTSRYGGAVPPMVGPLGIWFDLSDLDEGERYRQLLHIVAWMFDVMGVGPHPEMPERAKLCQPVALFDGTATLLNRVQVFDTYCRNRRWYLTELRKHRVPFEGKGTRGHDGKPFLWCDYGSWVIPGLGLCYGSHRNNAWYDWPATIDAGRFPVRHLPRRRDLAWAVELREALAPHARSLWAAVADVDVRDAVVDCLNKQRVAGFPDRLLPQLLDTARRHPGVGLLQLVAQPLQGRVTADET